MADTLVAAAGLGLLVTVFSGQPALHVKATKMAAESVDSVEMFQPLTAAIFENISRFVELTSLEQKCGTNDRAAAFLTTLNGGEAQSLYSPRNRAEAWKFQLAPTDASAGFERCNLQTFSSESTLEPDHSGLYTCLTIQNLEFDIVAEFKFNFLDALSNQSVSCGTFVTVPNKRRFAEMIYSIRWKRRDSTKDFSRLGGTYHGRTNRCRKANQEVSEDPKMSCL